MAVKKRIILTLVEIFSAECFLRLTNPAKLLTKDEARRITTNIAPSVTAVRRQAAVGLFAMSALPPKADIAERDWDVRFVPKADIHLYSMTLFVGMAPGR